jgi:CRISPR-associated exonuclease Cas4
MSDYGEIPEPIPLSHLNAYAYCPRRFYYEFVLGEMVVNEHVLGGQQLHERVDLPGSSTREEKKQLRHIYVCAPKLGAVGYCDLIEMSEETNTNDLATLALAGKLYPVEYKKGKMGKWISDHTQLCAQALALEEVLEIATGSIKHGYVYYFGSARRDEVAFDEARHVGALNQPPPPLTNWRKCRDCSLEPICLPREVLAMDSRKAEIGNGNRVSD